MTGNSLLRRQLNKLRSTSARFIVISTGSKLPKNSPKRPQNRPKRARNGTNRVENTKNVPGAAVLGEKTGDLFNKEAVINPATKPPEPELTVETMSVEQLLELRAKIQARLPMKLTDLNLESELMLQYTQGKLLLNLVSTDKETPANQKAQVQNSCAATLEQLVKLQTRLYDAERMKRIEQALIKAVKAHLPAEGQEAFFDAYAKIYNEGGGEPWVMS